MARYDDNVKLLVQTFPNSLPGTSVTWYTKLDISKIKKWMDLAHVLSNISSIQVTVNSCSL